MAFEFNMLYASRLIWNRNRSTGVEAAKEPDGVGKPRVESDADEVVAAREGAEAVRERDVVLHLAILGRNDVGVLAHRVTAPAGQVRIGRGGDAIALVIGRCHRQIIGDAHLAAERAAE